jgi:hypothetical protein
VDSRLIPLNGVVALLRNEPSWFSALADQGFRLHLIEADVQSTPAVIRADVIFYRRDPDLIILCECKSGKNIQPRQARSYVAADFAGLRQRGTNPGHLPAGTPVQAVFAGLEPERDALVESMQREGIEAPLLTIGPGRACLEIAGVTGMEEFDVEDRRAGLPPMRFRIDADSPSTEIKELVVPEIVAAQSRGDEFIDLNGLAQDLLLDWAALGLPAQRGFVKRLKDAGRELAQDGMRGDISVESGNNIAPRITILRRMVERDPRGAPQAWQAQARRAAQALGRGDGPAAEAPAQMSLDDLYRETEPSD